MVCNLSQDDPMLFEKTFDWRDRCMEELKRIFNKLYVHKDVYFAEEVIIMSITSFSTILKNTLVSGILG